MLDEIVTAFSSVREEILQLRRGYSFAGEIYDQVKTRSMKVMLGLEADLDLFGISFLLADYQLQLSNLNNEDITAFECGFGIYVGTHRKNHKFMQDYWTQLKNKFGYLDVSSSEIDVPKVRITEESADRI